MLTTAGRRGRRTDGLTSLREAVAYADSHPGPDTITFDPAALGNGPGRSCCQDGPLVLTDPATTTIVGPAVSADDQRRRSGPGVRRTRRIAGPLGPDGRGRPGGRRRRDPKRRRPTRADQRHPPRQPASGRGGGLFNSGTAVLDNVTVYGNTDGTGDGVANVGALTSKRVTIRGNFARPAGGLFDSLAARLF